MPTPGPRPTCSRATSLAPGRAPPSELRPAARAGRPIARGTGGGALGAGGAQGGARGTCTHANGPRLLLPSTTWPQNDGEPRDWLSEAHALTQDEPALPRTRRKRRAPGRIIALGVLLLIVAGIAWFANALFQPFKGDGGERGHG